MKQEVSTSGEKVEELKKERISKMKNLQKQRKKLQASLK